MQLFPREQFTQEAYLWAVSIVDSRALYWNNQAHLMPLLDVTVKQPEVIKLPRKQSADASEPVLATDPSVRFTTAAMRQMRGIARRRSR